MMYILVCKQKKNEMTKDLIDDFPYIFIVSGGKCLAANTMVQSLLVQYPENQIHIENFPNFSKEADIDSLFEKVRKYKTVIIAHTLVTRNLREKLIARCESEKIEHVDYMGPLSDFIEQKLGLESINKPGLFRKTNAPYYERIDAMEYTLNHDDGMSPERLKEADIILTGVSRVGKTPLSVYMAMFGWKVANVPLVLGIDPPKELFEVDKNRVFGLKISAAYLIPQRAKRLHAMNQAADTNYTDRATVNRELAYAQSIFERGGFTMISITNKPIESSANEITSIISKRFGFTHQKNKGIIY